MRHDRADKADPERLGGIDQLERRHLALVGQTRLHQRVHAAQPVYLDHLIAQNNPASPFVLRGFDFFFGANNVIQNNGFPVRAEGAGIAPGSIIPSTGNTTNRISLGYGVPIREVTWSDAGVDYQIDTNPNGIVQNFAQIKILPGVTIKMGLNANFSSIGATLRMQGLAGAPITIEVMPSATPRATCATSSSATPI